MRLVALVGVVVAAVAPQWMIALRYEPPRDASPDAASFEVAVERGVVDEHVDLPAKVSTEGAAVLPLVGVTRPADVDLRAAVGDSVHSGQLVAAGVRPLDSGGTTPRAIFFLTCPAARLADIEPGERGDAVRCLQLVLVRRGAKIPRAETDGGVLGAATQAALAELYQSAGFAAPVTESGLEVKRLDADAAVLAAKLALAAVAPGDAAGAELARVRLLSATVQRDLLRDHGGVRMVADDFLVAPSDDVVLVGTETSDDGGVGIAVSWGGPVITVDVPSEVWGTVDGAVDHRLVNGSTISGLSVSSSTVADGGTQRVTCVAGPGPADAAAVASGATGDIAVRFVLRTTTTPVVSVPAVAVRHDGPTSFVTVLGSDRRRRRVVVVETDRIGGRAILDGADALEGIGDVIVT